MLIDKLKPYAKQIEKAAAYGDHDAKQIIRLLGISVLREDSMSTHLCEQAFDQWLAAHDWKSASPSITK